ncbi:MAG: GlsB/YeaQ/YmgE family stress response membrane protein [Anaerolineaceae bacterium]|nr:GlsB/YeaQ/YmgE family stress response membrane protein [Anaerolineaceae bacterium]
MDLVSIVLWIVLGGVAGWIASIIMKRNAQMGMVANIVVGIVGALIGGFVVDLLGFAPASGFNFYSLLVAILGAVILLAIVGYLRRATN